VETAVSAEDALGPLSAIQGRRVALAAAARELSQAWDAADDEARRTRGEGMFRRREVNLIVHVGRAVDEGPARAAAAQFATEHSVRTVIVASATPSIAVPGQDLLGSPALISTTCFIDQDSGRQVCSEMVIIEAAGEEARAARAAVSGLLVPDLPVLGWWAGAFSQVDPELLWLAGLSDQLVVDSARAAGDLGAEAATGIQALAGLLQTDLGSRARDLAWLRVTPWRALTAELFDDPVRRDLIPRVNHLKVEHHNALPEALLFAGWFGSRLGLNAVGERWQEGASRCVVLQPHSGAGRAEEKPASIVIELHSLGPQGDEAPGLAGVNVYAGASSPATPKVDLAGDAIGSTRVRAALPAVSMRRRLHSRVCSACVMQGAGEVRVKTLEMAPDEDWRLLSQIFERPRADTVFVEAVGLAAVLSGGSG
jgi:glucose-6-phosphate dehydrogenase assembly protein OpcA